MSERKNSHEERLSLTADLKSGTETAGSIQCDEPRDLSRHLRTANRKRQLVGIIMSGIGISILLFVGVGLVEGFEIVDLNSVPVVAVFLVLGFVTIGGGFGMMMSAAPGFDDDEFDRLLASENLVQAMDEHRDPFAADSAPDRSADNDPGQQRFDSQSEHGDHSAMVEEQLVDS